MELSRRPHAAATAPVGHPSVSVLVTTFNQDRFLAATLDSIRRQTVPPREVIVVDDGSTDSTAEILERVADITVVRQSNQGIAAARNAAVERATGDLLAFIDGDDLWHPDRVARLRQAYSLHPDVGLIVSEVECFEDCAGGEQIGSRSKLGGRFGAANGTWRGRCFEELLFEGSLFWTMSQVAVPRTVAQKIGRSDPRFRISSDYDLYLRISRRYDVLVLEEHLARWRQVSGSASGMGIRQRIVNWRLDSARVVKSHRDRLSGSERHRYSEAYRTHRDRLCRYVYDRNHLESRASGAAELLRISLALRDTGALAYAAGLCVPSWMAAAVGRRLGMGR
jgi:glycosyltransferase involved in cell wall biosynthesis